MNRQILIVIAAVLFISGVIWIGVSRGKSSHEGIHQTKSADVENLVEDAGRLAADNELLKAKEAYEAILAQYPDYENISDVQSSLEDLNLQIISSSVQTSQTAVHEIKSGDSIGKIAKLYGMTPELIKKSNGLKSDVIRIGQKLRVWKGHFNIFVDKSQNILMLKDGDEIVKVYHVSTGTNNITPVGKFKITSKLANPVWFNKGVAVPPESPQNVLGTRWMGFDIAGYGIHGTTEPESIGKQVTAGCVRMRNAEVEELYTLIPLGTEVTIID